MAKGIEERHTRSCRTAKGGRCDCEPSYRASVWDGERQERVRYTADSLTEAQQWRHDARLALRRGRRVAVKSAVTLGQAVADWQKSAADGVVRTHGGEQYKPGALRAYERALRLRVLPRFGHEPLIDLKRADWQQLVDELVAERLAPATITITVAAAAVVYGHEVSRERLRDNPLHGLQLPAPRKGRDHVVGAVAAAAMLEALPDQDRALWATAMYAGLRRGELRALRVSDADLTACIIRVERGYDDQDGVIETKGRTKRQVPVPSLLCQRLREHLMRTGRRGDELLFGATSFSPFSPTRVTARADKAWEAAGLERLTLHEARHCYASYMIAAGVNAKALSTYMGHASIAITLDTYGHMLPGNEEEAATLLDAYLDRSEVGSSTYVRT